MDSDWWKARDPQNRRLQHIIYTHIHVFYAYSMRTLHVIQVNFTGFWFPPSRRGECQVSHFCQPRCCLLLLNMLIETRKTKQNRKAQQCVWCSSANRSTWTVPLQIEATSEINLSFTCKIHVKYIWKKGKIWVKHVFHMLKVQVHIQYPFVTCWSHIFLRRPLWSSTRGRRPHTNSHSAVHIRFCAACLSLRPSTCLLAQSFLVKSCVFFLAMFFSWSHLNCESHCSTLPPYGFWWYCYVWCPPIKLPGYAQVQTKGSLRYPWVWVSTQSIKEPQEYSPQP